MTGTAEMRVEVRQGEGTSSLLTGLARQHYVSIDQPTPKGGSDWGPLGSELVLLGWAGCFLSTLMAAARAREVAVKRLKVIVKGELGQQPARFKGITLEVRGSFPDEETREELLATAKNGCLVTNTLKAAVPLEIRYGTAS